MLDYYGMRTPSDSHECFRWGLDLVDRRSVLEGPTHDQKLLARWYHLLLESQPD